MVRKNITKRKRVSKEQQILDRLEALRMNQKLMAYQVGRLKKITWAFRFQHIAWASLILAAMYSFINSPFYMVWMAMSIGAIALSWIAGR